MNYFKDIKQQYEPNTILVASNSGKNKEDYVYVIVIISINLLSYL